MSFISKAKLTWSKPSLRKVVLTEEQRRCILKSPVPVKELASDR